MLGAFGQFFFINLITFFFFPFHLPFSFPLWHKDPCARDLLWMDQKIIDISINSYNFFFLLFSSFLYDGARIQDDDTPASLDMEDNGMFKGFLVSYSDSLFFKKNVLLDKLDTIDVMVERKSFKTSLNEKSSKKTYTHFYFIYIRGWRFSFDRTLGLVEGQLLTYQR